MKLDHIAITVSSLETSIRFYELFGFAVIQRFDRPDLRGSACFMERDEFRLELWEFTDSIPGAELDNLKVKGIRHVAFRVEKIEEEMQKFFAKGVIFSELKIGGSGGKYSFTSDPDGVQIEFYEPKI